MASSHIVPGNSQGESPVAHPKQRPDTKEIKPEKRKKVRCLLHKFYTQFQLTGEARPTSLGSSAPMSTTMAPGRSALADALQSRPAVSTPSNRTSCTDTRSMHNGMEQGITGKKSLDPVRRAKKALMRHLGGCGRDCRKRKVKCFLSHYAIEQLLDGSHTPQDAENVGWALRVDTDPHDSPGVFPDPQEEATSTGEVMERVNQAFGIGSQQDNYYPQYIQDRTDTLLNREIQPTDSLEAEPDFVHEYSIRRYDNMHLVGEKVYNPPWTPYGPELYCCSRVPECLFTCPDPTTLLIHYSVWHIPVKTLEDSPLRLVCSYCDTFFAFPNQRCSNQSCTSLPYPIEKVYGEQLGISLDNDAEDMQAGFSHTGVFAQGRNLQQSQGYGWGSDPDQFPDTQFNSSFGGGVNSGGWGRGFKASRLKLAYTTSLSNPFQSIRGLVQGRKCLFVFVFLVLLLLLISLWKHVLVIILSSRETPVLRSLDFPPIGFIVMSLSFCAYRLGFARRTTPIGTGLSSHSMNGRG